jgi:hypothetical protein
MTTALAQIPVGVIVTRRKAASPWVDYIWQPTSVLVGQPETAPWTLLSDSGDQAMFYAGSALLELYASDTGNYRDNLAGDNALWVVLRPTGVDPPYEVAKVTADPSEGEASTEGGDQIVESLRMPDSLREFLASFVAEHHVEQPFFKRQRKRPEPEALARRVPHQRKGDV